MQLLAAKTVLNAEQFVEHLMMEWQRREVVLVDAVQDRLVSFVNEIVATGYTPAARSTVVRLNAFVSKSNTLSGGHRFRGSRR